MNAKEAIKAMTDNDNRSLQELSYAIGKNRSYLSNLQRKQGLIAVDTLLLIAGECGYKLQLIKDNDTISIDSFAYDKH